LRLAVPAHLSLAFNGVLLTNRIGVKAEQAQAGKAKVDPVALSDWQATCCSSSNGMNFDDDRNYISVGSWMFILLVAALPFIGWIMVLVWALTGENETRKNYFRAILAWIAVLVGLVVILALLGHLPQIEKQLGGWTHKG